MKLENIKWHNSKNIDQILRSFAEGKTDYPVLCPDCGSSCGLEVVGASFFPPCMNDDLDYTITVREVTKEKKIKLARLFGRNVAEFIKEFRENGQVQKTEKLEDAKTTIQCLIESEISFDISPDLMKKYPHLIGCQYRD